MKKKTGFSYHFFSFPLFSFCIAPTFFLFYFSFRRCIPQLCSYIYFSFPDLHTVEINFFISMFFFTWWPYVSRNHGQLGHQDHRISCNYYQDLSAAWLSILSLYIRTVLSVCNKHLLITKSLIFFSGCTCGI